MHPLPPELTEARTVRPHVLVVDDDEDLRAWIKSKLKKAGYVVTLADSGDAALLLLMLNTYDALVIDVLMPGTSGLDTIRAWRRLRLDFVLPVLFLSSKANKNDIAAGLEAGGDDYLTKPVSAEVLLAKLQAAIRARRQLLAR